MTLIEELQALVERTAAAAGAAVVGIGPRWGRGSGLVIGDGRVLTSAHNLRGDAAVVSFSDGRVEAAHALGVDLDGDLAVVSVDTGAVVPLEWTAQQAQPGTPVLGLANPGGRGLRVTFGLVSATERAFPGPRGRRIVGGIEHTAPLPRGASGGPVLDGDGRLLGINTHRLGDGFYLAIPADAALREAVEALGRGEVPEHPRLGVALADPDTSRGLRRAVGLDDRSGLLVRGVEEGGPADAAGIRHGDLLVAAEGRTLERVDTLFEILEDAADGLTIEVVRGMEERTVRVRFGAGGRGGSA